MLTDRNILVQTKSVSTKSLAKKKKNCKTTKFFVVQTFGRDICWLTQVCFGNDHVVLPLFLQKKKIFFFDHQEVEGVVGGGGVRVCVRLMHTHTHCSPYKKGRRSREVAKRERESRTEDVCVCFSTRRVPSIRSTCTPLSTFLFMEAILTSSTFFFLEGGGEGRGVFS